MGLQADMPITDIKLDRVFIGSCTNSRIEDLRAAAAVAKGRKVAPTLKQVLIVPGSGLVKAQAEKEGLEPSVYRSGHGMARARVLNVLSVEGREAWSG